MLSKKEIESLNQKLPKSKILDIIKSFKTEGITVSYSAVYRALKGTRYNAKILKKAMEIAKQYQDELSELKEFTK